ncbi:membrane protein UL20 [Mandrillus leucophaeus cytomegalovirus]|uniref:Membrane protein UL20 n=1 Tax=Mandrillus leucophaeus cytomegalovirus TaxID=1654930 RepID=A0A0G2UPG3_9BETA|nr:membrane protein UL20 [Mandrillus leucophaeus cytomegalovirus]AKI29796.1 membrane protein UL20 [Mandrillus leucophaeus cytomegalovirus]
MSRTWLALLTLWALTVPACRTSYVYVSVLTSSYGPTWTAIGEVNVTNTSELSTTHRFIPGNITNCENVSPVDNGNGSVSQLPAECLRRVSGYLGTIWILKCNESRTKIENFWYRGEGYDHSQNCTSPLVNYLQTMYSIWKNRTDANKFTQKQLTALEVRCLVPETYSINDTIKHYNDSSLSREHQQLYRQRYPENHTCSLTEALILDELQRFAAISKMLMVMIEGLSFIMIAMFSTIVLVKFYYCNKTPCSCMLPRNPRRNTCEDIVIESKAEQPESGEDTAPSSPTEPESTETTPIMSASYKPYTQKPPDVPPKPTTFPTDATMPTWKPVIPPKPKPTSLAFQFPAPKPETTNPAKAINSPKVFTFNEQDIQKHKEETTKKRKVIYPSHQPATPADSVLTPLLPPPPGIAPPRRIGSGSPRVPMMIPWDNTRSPSPTLISSWAQRNQSLPSELDPWELKANRWL